MNLTSSSLRLNNKRRVGFQEGGRWSNFKNKVIELIHAAIRAPTGSPSDVAAEGESESSTSTSAFVTAHKLLNAEKDGQDWEIDEVVVNGENTDYLHNERDTGSPYHSDSGGDKDSGEHVYVYHPPTLRSKMQGFGRTITLFFNQKFDDPEVESDFQKLQWYSTKAWAFYGSLFLVVNWIFYLGLNLDSTRGTVYGQALYYGGLTFVTVPFLSLSRRTCPFAVHFFFMCGPLPAVWYCAMSESVETRVCHFFDKNTNSCDGKDFLAQLYYATALPAIMLFAFSATPSSLINAIFQVVQLVLYLVFVIPVQPIYARNVVSFVIFSVFFQGLHFNREVTSRRLYLLNTQLKVAYRAQLKAQSAQFRASQAKRRFASYIFHEVRVPLNNAAIAFNNMTSTELFRNRIIKDKGVAEDVTALDVSLATVQQVLNDSLDLEKMDAGHFDINPRAFCLHKVIQSTLGPIAVSAASKNLALHIHLDEAIDKLRPSLDLNTNESDLGQTWVVGDEVRLRQILTNLASNAVKFTPENADTGITVNTQLIAHRTSTSRQNSNNGYHTAERAENGKNIDLERGEGETDKKEQPQSGDALVFKLEIIDSGPGIKPSDLVDNQLFQPFAQTKIGKLSKNSTGLGLAIVRQIVTLSGGKLGVHSRRGKGATFWIELHYPVANSSEIRAAKLQESRISAPAFATTATIANLSERWPAVAFAEDVKPPMLTGTVGHQRISSSPDILPYLRSTASPLPTPSLFRLDSDIPLLEIRPRSDEKILDTPNEQKVPGLLGSSTELKSSSEEDSGEGPLVVLVVDDNFTTRNVMARALQNRGCIVYTARDGKECLDLVLGSDAKSYDLISLDNDMPVMTGEEAVKAMREAGRNDFVVGCTGNALTDDQKRFLDAGADAVLIKPVNFARLSEFMEIARERRLRFIRS